MFTIETARQVAARIWCDPEYSHVVMDPELAEVIATLLYEHAAESILRGIEEEDVTKVDYSDLRFK